MENGLEDMKSLGQKTFFELSGVTFFFFSKRIFLGETCEWIYVERNFQL